MKIWIVKYLDCVDDTSFWEVSRVFSTEEKAKEYCKNASATRQFHYDYEEYEVE